MKKFLSNIFQKNSIACLFLTAVVFYFCCRMFFLIIYNFRYTDEDQIVMWLGTVLISRGELHEPMWLGQNYGSMLESVLAVPLYWFGISLNVALPLASLLVSSIPFIIVLLMCLRKKDYLKCWLILGVLLLYSVDMDVLTSIPRSFLPGFAFTVIGLLLYKDRKNSIISLICGYLLLYGVVISENAICIVIPVIIGIVADRIIKKEKINFKKDALKNVCFICGLAIAYIQKLLYANFYEKNPEYLVWNKPDFSFDFSLLFQRIHHFGDFFSELVIFRNAWIFVFIILIVCLVLVFTDNYGSAIIVLSTLGGLFLTLGFPKVFLHDSVLWSPARMFLFVPYNMMLAIFFSDIRLNSRIVDRLQSFSCRKYCILALSIITFVFFYKYVDLKLRIDEFTSSDMNGVISVGELKEIVQEEYSILDNTGCDFAVVSDAMYAEAGEALSNREKTFWSIDRINRNNNTFLEERYKNRDTILFVTIDEEGNCSEKIVSTDNRSAIQYLYEEYSSIRSGMYSKWDGTK